jgi:lipoprotein signal peptidase
MILYLVSAGLVWALDRASKHLVYNRLGSNPHVSFRLFFIRPTLKPKSHSPIDSLLLIIWLLASGAALILIIIIGGAYSTPLAQIGLGAAIGGGAGNLYDRWRFGAIQDFIGWKSSVFNIADVAIVFGIAMALLSLLNQ